MNLFELKKDRAQRLDAADAIVKQAEAAKRQLSPEEGRVFAEHMKAVRDLNPEIERRAAANTIVGMRDEKGLILADKKPSPSDVSVMAFGNSLAPRPPASLSEEYYNDFYQWLGSRGERISAALYEGSGSSGGYVVPVVVEDQIVPLAPTEMGVRSIATVIPTVSDIKIPRGTAFGAAAAKAEGDGTGDNLFTETDPTLDQFTLSAYMAGGYRSVSWELTQDVPSFNQFAISDLLIAQQLYEGNKYVNGTGTGQAQGLIGNTGAGITGVLVGSDNYASELLNATFDVLGTLNAVYHPGASWLMSRATGVVIRKAQMQANLFTPVWTRENGRDYLHGYPVVFDGNMPSIAASHTPVLFGDFKQGYVIGDRGGSGINVKILDQPKALEGLLVLLAYRRTDGRVRRSEAIQAITLHS